VGVVGPELSVGLSLPLLLFGGSGGFWLELFSDFLFLFSLLSILQLTNKTTVIISAIKIVQKSILLKNFGMIFYLDNEIN
jgi:hypothetical protein